MLGSLCRSTLLDVGPGERGLNRRGIDPVGLSIPQLVNGLVVQIEVQQRSNDRSVGRRNEDQWRWRIERCDGRECVTVRHQASRGRTNALRL